MDRHVFRASMHRLLLVTLVGCLLIPTVAWGGNSKISGRVSARQTGEPLAGANVVIATAVLSGGQEVPLDRPLGAAADAEGYFFILDVPPGVYTLRASLVGFAPEFQRLVRVESDRTITVNFQLASTELQLEGVEVTANRDIVRPDVSTTQEVISTTRIEQMPILRIDEFMGKVKGVELVSNADGNGLSVRGGTIRETDVRVDGISLQDPRTDNSYLALNSTSVQEIQVLTGGFEAKYGNIRSGLLNVVTKEGHRDRYTVSLKTDFAPAHQQRFFGMSPWDNDSWIYKVYAGQYAMHGVSPTDTTVPAEFRTFPGWAARTTLLPQPIRTLDSLQRLDLWKKQHPQYDVASKPDLYFEGSITGPFPGESLPILGEYASRTTFLLGFKYEDSQMAFPVGPRDNYLDWNTQLKLSTALSSTMRLAVNGLYAKVQTASAGRASSYGGALVDQASSFGFLNSTSSSVAAQARLIGDGSFNQLFNKSRLQFFDERYILGGAKFTHTLSNSAFYTVDLQVGYTDQVLSPFAMDTNRTDQFVYYDRVIGTTTFHSRFNVPEFGSPMASTNYGFDALNTFAMYGGPQRIDSSYSWVYQLKGDLTAQIGRHHQLEAGISARLQHLFVYTGTWFQSQLSYTPDTWEYYKVTPLEMGLYVQDKLEFEGMTLNAGLRLDYLNPMKKGYQIGFPESEEYAKLYADIYSNLPGAAGTYDRWVAFRALLADPPGWPTTENRVQTYLSPRLGVSFPITEASKLYFNYGHFYQRPAVSFMYNTQLNLGSVAVPTPDLDMARTVSYEFGYEQMVLNDFVVNITAYYKDVRGEPLSRSYINYYEDNIVSRYYADAYRDIRGVEVRLERPMGRFVTFNAMYDYMVQSSGQSGLARVYENRLKAKDNELRSPNITVTDPLPRANIALNLHTPNDFGPEAFGIHWLGGLFANFLFEWRDGGRILLNPEEPDVKLWNYVDVVNYWNIDFRGSKNIVTDFGALELVVTVQNLTNNKWLVPGNMTEAQYSDYKQSLKTPDKGGSDKWGDWKSDDGHIKIGWWQAPIFLNPRRIILGLRLNL
jgi:hypothetical protein